MQQTSSSPLECLFAALAGSCSAASSRWRWLWLGLRRERTHVGRGMAIPCQTILRQTGRAGCAGGQNSTPHMEVRTLFWTSGVAQEASLGHVAAAFTLDVYGHITALVQRTWRPLSSG